MNRKPGDHGTANQALEWVLDQPIPAIDVELFLRAWQLGDLDEWPDFNLWLSGQPQ